MHIGVGEEVAEVSWTLEGVNDDGGNRDGETLPVGLSEEVAQVS